MIWHPSWIEHHSLVDARNVAVAGVVGAVGHDWEQRSHYILGYKSGPEGDPEQHQCCRKDRGAVVGTPFCEVFDIQARVKWLVTRR